MAQDPDLKDLGLRETLIPVEHRPLYFLEGVQAARRFRSVGMTEWGKLSELFEKRISDPENHRPVIAGDAAAAVTNLSFSCELTLKALSVVCRGTAVEGHNLLNLYSILSDEKREEASTKYLDLRKQTKGETLGWKDARLKWGMFDFPPFESSEESEASNSSEDDKADSLKTILDDAAGSFMDFRYIFERSIKREKAYTFDFFRFCIACAALEDSLEPPKEYGQVSLNSDGLQAMLLK